MRKGQLVGDQDGGPMIHCDVFGEPAVDRKPDHTPKVVAIDLMSRFTVRTPPWKSERVSDGVEAR